MKADQFYNKTRAWFVEYFRDSKEVIRGENKPEMIKGTFFAKYSAAMGMTQPYENDITVRIKDRAIKVIINNFRTAPPGAKGYAIETTGVKSDGTMRSGGAYQKTFKDIEIKCHALTDDLKAYIEKKKKDW